MKIKTIFSKSDTSFYTYRRFGLLHIGVSFENEYKYLRYDFKKRRR